MMIIDRDFQEKGLVTFLFDSNQLTRPILELWPFKSEENETKKARNTSDILFAGIMAGSVAAMLTNGLEFISTNV